jgi:hypothetical protein
VSCSVMRNFEHTAQNCRKSPHTEPRTSGTTTVRTWLGTFEECTRTRTSTSSNEYEYEAGSAQEGSAYRIQPHLRSNAHAVDTSVSLKIRTIYIRIQMVRAVTARILPDHIPTFANRRLVGIEQIVRQVDRFVPVHRRTASFCDARAIRAAPLAKLCMGPSRQCQ